MRTKEKKVTSSAFKTLIPKLFLAMNQRKRNNNTDITGYPKIVIYKSGEYKFLYADLIHIYIYLKLIVHDWGFEQNSRLKSP